MKITGHLKEDDCGNRQEGNLDIHHEPDREDEDDLAEHLAPAQGQEPGKGHVDLFFLGLTDNRSNMGKEHKSPEVAIDKGRGAAGQVATGMAVIHLLYMGSPENTKGYLEKWSFCSISALF